MKVSRSLLGLELIFQLRQVMLQSVPVLIQSVSSRTSGTTALGSRDAVQSGSSNLARRRLAVVAGSSIANERPLEGGSHEPQDTITTALCHPLNLRSILRELKKGGYAGS